MKPGFHLVRTRWIRGFMPLPVGRAAAQVSPDVEALTGSGPRDFASFAADHAWLFAPAAAAARR
jgi:hypothetical protein